MRRGRKKALYRRERDSLEGPYEEAEIQRKVFGQEKNLAFSEETCLEKERVRLKIIPRKVGVGLKRKWELIAPINSRLNVMVRSLIPFGLGQNGCWLFQESQLLRALHALYRCNLLL